MTPPPDPVAALAEALRVHGISEHPDCGDHGDDYGLGDIDCAGQAPSGMATEMLAALTAAGWSLSHDSERDALAAAEARVAVLVEAIPEDPWMTEGPIEYRCYAPSCRARVVSGHHPDEEGWSVADHERECEWVTARAALRGQR